MTPRIGMQVFCQEQPSRDGKFYRSFVAADYAGLWLHCEHAQQRHFYEAGTLFNNYVNMSILCRQRHLCSEEHLPDMLL